MLRHDKKRHIADARANPESSSATKLIIPFSIGQPICHTKDKIRQLIRLAVQGSYEEVILFGADECQKYLFQTHDPECANPDGERTEAEAIAHAVKLGDDWQALCTEILAEREFADARVTIKRWCDFPYGDRDKEKLRRFFDDNPQVEADLTAFINTRAKTIISKKNHFQKWPEADRAKMVPYCELLRQYADEEGANFLSWVRHLDWSEGATQRNLAIRYPGRLEKSNFMSILANEGQLLQEQGTDTPNVCISFESITFDFTQRANGDRKVAIPNGQNGHAVQTARNGEASSAVSYQAMMLQVARNAFYSEVREKAMKHEEVDKDFVRGLARLVGGFVEDDLDYKGSERGSASSSGASSLEDSHEIGGPMFK